ncbi:MAG: hypothetical protein V4717_14975, partial [Bacteroidota bacterium]
MKLNLLFRNSRSSGTAFKTGSVSNDSTGTNALPLLKAMSKIGRAIPGLYLVGFLLFSVLGFQVNAQTQVIQWNGIIDGSFSAATSRVIGNVAASDFVLSTSWQGGNATSTI